MYVVPAMAIRSPGALKRPLSELVIELRNTNLPVAIEAAQVIESLRSKGEELVVDIRNNVASRGDVTVALTSAQAVLLHILHARYGEVVSLQALHDGLYGKQVSRIAPRVPNTLRVQINLLRPRLEPLRAVIHTSHGRGYQLELLPVSRDATE